MAIDLHALERAATGDPDAKVAVKRRWLAEVHRELKELERLRRQRASGDPFNDLFRNLFR